MRQWASFNDIDGNGLSNSTEKWPEFYIEISYPRTTEEENPEDQAKCRQAVRALVARWDREGIDTPASGDADPKPLDGGD